MGRDFFGEDKELQPQAKTSDQDTQPRTEALTEDEKAAAEGFRAYQDALRTRDEISIRRTKARAELEPARAAVEKSEAQLKAIEREISILRSKLYDMAEEHGQKMMHDATVKTTDAKLKAEKAEEAEKQAQIAWGKRITELKEQTKLEAGETPDELKRLEETCAEAEAAYKMAVERRKKLEEEWGKCFFWSTRQSAKAQALIMDTMEVLTDKDFTPAEFGFSPAEWKSFSEVYNRWNSLRQKLETARQDYQDRWKRTEDYRAEESKLDQAFKDNTDFLLEWLHGEHLPPLNENTVSCTGKICVQYLGDRLRPLLPAPHVYFYHVDNWQQEGAVDFISSLWQGFSKAMPEELLDISVVDPSQMVRFKIGSPTGLRIDFAKAYQEGFAEKEGTGPVRSRIRGLFTERDIAELDRELEKTQNRIQNYDVEHFSDILDDPTVKKYGDPEKMPPIRRVNLYTYTHDRPPLLHRYHVVIFVVPREEQGRAVLASMEYMSNLILRGNAMDFGFIPIFLAPEPEQDGRWQELTRAIVRSGRVDGVDLGLGNFFTWEGGRK